MKEQLTTLVRTVVLIVLTVVLLYPFTFRALLYSLHLLGAF